MSLIQTLEQVKRGVARAIENARRKIYYVDSINGSNSYNGLDPVRPFASLAYALTKAAAGDVISCAPGGSEAITAALTMSAKHRLKIICPCGSAEQDGYLVYSASDIELMDIDAKNVEIRGLRFKHTGTTTSRSAIRVLGGNGTSTGQLGQQALIRDCVFNEAGADGKTDYGITLIGNCQQSRVQGCTFLGCKYGVYLKDHGSDTSIHQMPTIEGCTFYNGKSAYFGIYSDAAVQVNGARVKGNTFFDANGDGSAATAAWDGSNGANATQGPLKISATCDQWLISDNRAYTANANSFQNFSYVTSGAVAKFMNNETASWTPIDLLLAAGADSTAVATAAQGIGNKADSAVQAKAGTKSLMGYIKGLVDALLDTAGIATWPAAVAPANGTNLFEALGWMYEKQGYRMVTKNTGSLAAVTTDDLFTVTGLCELIVVGVIKTTIARAGGAVTHEVGTSGNTAGVLAQAADCRQANGTLLLSADASGKTCGAFPAQRIVNAATVIMTLSNAPDSGDIDYYCWYRPISATGAVAAAA